MAILNNYKKLCGEKNFIKQNKLMIKKKELENKEKQKK